MRAVRNPAFGGVPAALGSLVVASLVVGCGGDNPVSPKPSAWTEAPIPEAVWGPGGLLGIAFHGDRGLVAGFQNAGTVGPLVLETSDGKWTPASIPALPSTMIPLGVAFTSTGDAVLGGVDQQGSTIALLDERNGWSRVDLGLIGGIQGFAEGGGVLRAVGTSLHGVSLVSAGADVWTADDPGFVTTQANDKGMVDVAWHDGVFYACGFDDAADGSPQEPSNVVLQNDGTGWTRIESPIEDGTWEPRAIAVTGEGILLVGGAVTDFSAGAADQYVATLVARGTDGTWTTVSLPHPGTLDEVQDILVTSTGKIMLACGNYEIHFLEGSVGKGFTDEGPATRGEIRSLAEDASGTIYGCGWTLIDQGDVALTYPLLLKREP